MSGRGTATQGPLWEAQCVVCAEPKALWLPL